MFQEGTLLEHSLIAVNILLFSISVEVEVGGGGRNADSNKRGFKEWKDCISPERVPWKKSSSWHAARYDGRKQQSPVVAGSIEFNKWWVVHIIRANYLLEN